MSTPTLRINSKPLDFRELPPSVNKAYAALCKLPDSELFTTREALKRINMGESTLNLVVANFSDISELHKQKRIFGNPKTIALYRSQRKSYEASR